MKPSNPVFSFHLVGFLLIAATLALTAGVAQAQTESIEICPVDIRTLERIQPSCQKSYGDILQPVMTGSRNWDDEQDDGTVIKKVCTHQFWSYGGRYFPGDQPAIFQISPGEHLIATEWYFCSADGPGGGEPRVSIHAIDMTTQLWMSKGVLEHVDPIGAAGACLASDLLSTNPCWTQAGVDIDQILAEDFTQNLYFAVFAGRTALQRDIDPPALSAEVPLYTLQELLPEPVVGEPEPGQPFDPGPPMPFLCTGGGVIKISGRCVDFGGLMGKWEHLRLRARLVEEGLSVVPLHVIDRFMFPEPLCDAEGECGGVTIRFFDDQNFTFRLHDAATGKVVTKETRLADGSALLAIPAFFNLEEAYLVSLQAIGGDNKPVEVPVAASLYH